MDEVVNLSIVMIWFWYVMGFFILTVFIMIFANDKYVKIIFMVFAVSLLISWFVTLWFM